MVAHGEVPQPEMTIQTEDKNCDIDDLSQDKLLNQDYESKEMIHDIGSNAYRPIDENKNFIKQEIDDSISCEVKKENIGEREVKNEFVKIETSIDFEDTDQTRIDLTVCSSLFLDSWLQMLHSYFDDMFRCINGIILRGSFGNEEIKEDGKFTSFDVSMSEESLEAHVRQIHSIENKHKCQQCGNMFPHMIELELHFRLHSGDKSTICHICRRQLSSLQTLRSHLRTHTGAKPYRCKICGECFAQSATLVSHKKTHGSEIPSFKCGECGRLFYQRGGLNVHFKNHLGENGLGEKNFTCAFCGKYIAFFISFQLSLLDFKETFHILTMQTIYFRQLFLNALYDSLVHSHAAFYIRVFIGQHLKFFLNGVKCSSHALHRNLLVTEFLNLSVHYLFYVLHFQILEDCFTSIVEEVICKSTNYDSELGVMKFEFR
ncbi:unnamed protein product, partial [Timema podura]|nr:unnamed protein product [Timema podura]